MRKEKIIEFLVKSRRYVGLIIIVLSIIIFAWYIRGHPNTLYPIRSTPIYLIPILLLLYSTFLITNFLITVITITISKKSFSLKGSFILTIYSTLVNFFGPLQSGPGFRAVYLKKKIGISIKDYTLATFFYYAAFASISLVMMLGVKYPIISVLLVSVIAGAGLYYLRKQRISSLVRKALIIGVVTLVQLIIVAIIYYLELRATGYTPSISSTLTYTGSANLALFVAFTPGAVGIRESFIYLSQSIHGIPTENIINASLLDRSIYLLFLGILFLLSSALHINSKVHATPK
ncbi:MAG: hypothetical protein M3Q14_03650 [bacterium]|nr:hypothetical protein [bacterium]